jgi:hypothetical protein
MFGHCGVLKHMELHDVLYRTLLCVYGTIIYASLASYMTAYPHAHCVVV